MQRGRRGSTSPANTGRVSMRRASIAPTSTGRSAGASRIIVRSGASAGTKAATRPHPWVSAITCRLSSPSHRARVVPWKAGDHADHLLLKCYLDEKTDIGHFVTSKIQTLAGVKDTFTLITFKAFS